MNTKLIRSALILLSIMYNAVHAHVHYSLYDILLLPHITDGHVVFAMNAFGRKPRAFTAHNGIHDNPFVLWNCTESSLNMLHGFDPSSPIGQLGSLIDATDDGTRGHVLLQGKVKTPFAGIIGGCFEIGGGFQLIVYLPIYHAKLEHFASIDQTQNNNSEDARTKQYLTNNLAQVTLDLGGLSLADWHRTGVGDLVTYAQYGCHFEQNKEILKDVYLDGRIGLSLPTGKRADEDKLLAASFGNDGSAALLFGAGLQLELGYHFGVGLDIELTHIFSNTRCRRIKTSIDQTEFLLLQKEEANKDYGMNQRFDLYIESFDLPAGFSCTLGYQYFKHGDDELSLKTNAFSSLVANSARTLEEYTAHHILVNAAYDFTHLMDENAPVTPQLAFFAKFPVNGKNVILSQMLGFTVSINF